VQNLAAMMRAVSAHAGLGRATTPHESVTLRKFQLPALLCFITSVYSRPLWGEIPPFQKSPQKFKMNYAKIEFLSIAGVIFSVASGGFAPRPHRGGLCPWSRFAFTR